MHVQTHNDTVAILNPDSVIIGNHASIPCITSIPFRPILPK